MAAAVATIAAGMFIALVIYNIGAALAGRSLGYPVESFVVGNGPVLISTNLRGTRYELRPLPGGGSVGFAQRADGTAFEMAHPLARMLAALAGPLAVALVAVAAGGTAMLGEALRTWSDIVWVLTNPGEPLGIVSALEVQSATGGIALVLAKLAGFNLGPLAFTSGGVVLAEIVRLVTGKAPGGAVAKVWLLASLAIALALVALLAVKLATGQA
jgi:hypothetical protein